MDVLSKLWQSTGTRCKHFCCGDARSIQTFANTKTFTIISNGYQLTHLTQVDLVSFRNPKHHLARFIFTLNLSNLTQAACLTHHCRVWKCNFRPTSGSCKLNTPKWSAGIVHRQYSSVFTFHDNECKYRNLHKWNMIVSSVTQHHRVGHHQFVRIVVVWQTNLFWFLNGSTTN